MVTFFSVAFVEKIFLLFISQNPVCFDLTCFKLLGLKQLGILCNFRCKEALRGLKALIEFFELYKFLLGYDFFLFVDTCKFFAAKVIVWVFKSLNKSSTTSVSDCLLRILDA